MIQFQHNKLVISEIFTDKNGKTSATKTIGVFACIVSLFSFAICAVILIAIVAFMSKKDTDFTQVLSALQNFLMQCLALFTLGTSLLLTNRATKDAEITQNSEGIMKGENKE